MRKPPGADQLALPLAPAPTKGERLLDAIDEAKQRAIELLTPAPRPQLELVPTRPDGSPLDALPFQPPASWKLVERKGRVQRDGTVRGRRIVRRMTLYFDPLVAEELEAHCEDIDVDMCEWVNDAVRERLDRR
jgi:hypothetical protein